jgi:hypothetical protein
MFKIRLLSFIFVIGFNQASAVILTWDDLELGTGLRMCPIEERAGRFVKRDMTTLNFTSISLETMRL